MPARWVIGCIGYRQGITVRLLVLYVVSKCESFDIVRVDIHAKVHDFFADWQVLRLIEILR